MTIFRQKKKSWYHIQWFSDTDTPEERRLIFKLDCLIVPIAVITYWLKNVDAGTLNAAYVGGMKEELGFYGNELVRLQTMYTVGSVVGALPFCFILTYIPLYWSLPLMDLLWGVATLLQYRAQSFAELAAYRFLIGLFEAAFFPAWHYVFGSWYRGDEIARRGGLFYLGLTLGSLTANLIASGTIARLDGVSGLSGWRWMCIICAAITLPLGVIAYFVIPGTIDQPNTWFLTQQDLDLSKARLEKAGHQVHGKFEFKDTWGILSKPKFWLIVLVDILFWNAGQQTTSGVFVLWLKSLNRYTPSKINQLGAIAPGLGVLYILLANFSSDLLIGPIWAITFSHLWNIIGLIILTIWDVSEPAKWFAYSTIWSAYAMSSVFHGWINTELRGSPGERGFTLTLMSMIAQSTTAWLPLLVFKTVESPRFHKGFPFVLGCAISFIASVWLLRAWFAREEKRSQLTSPTSPEPLSDNSSGVEDHQPSSFAGSKGYQSTVAEIHV